MPSLISGRVLRPRSTPIRTATALWNHGPMMFETMQQQQVAWPQFQPGEIADLLAYLADCKTSPDAAIGNGTTKAP